MATGSSSTAPSSSSVPMPPTASNPSSVSAQFTYTNGSYFPVPFHLQQQPYVAAPPPPPAYVAPGVYSLPQYQHQATAQQLFQRDAQAIRPEALEIVKAALASSEIEHKAETKKKAIPRKAAGQNWEDPTLTEWPENDYRIFCGDLGNEVNDDVLSKAFSRFPSYNMARVYDGLAYEFFQNVKWGKNKCQDLKVIRDKRTGKTKGYGFVSFANPTDLAAAIKEMNGKYVGNRPIKLRKSNWKERTDLEALERQKNQFHKKTKFLKKANK